MVLRIILTSYFFFQIVVIHSLLDAKITNVLFLCHNKTILATGGCAEYLHEHDQLRGHQPAAGALSTGVLKLQCCELMHVDTFVFIVVEIFWVLYQV